jgi:uncharacterized membrane protein YgcG
MTPSSPTRRRPSRVALRALLLLLAATPLGAQERQLHWTAVDVTAHLDSAGRLHVRERQDMVFTGDWNGGERLFNINLGQDLDVDRVVRIDSLGQEHPLTDGDLSEVDQYTLGSGWTLRWRSRQPSDPLFNNTPITYVLDLTYDNILEIVDGGGFRLNHDFAFANRVGSILKYTLKLTLDPVWHAPGDFTGEFGPVMLPPGESFGVDIPLRFSGAGRPGGVIFGASTLLRQGLAAGLLLGIVVLFMALLARERRLGRFAPLVPPTSITEEWLREHVLDLPPEAVGAAWDDRTAGPEVAAVLARLVAEGKLKSEVRTTGKGFFKSDIMYLELLVDRNKLRGYERELIDALFTSGSRFTDTESVRQRYKSSGFDPASKIKDGIDAILKGEGKSGTGSPKPGKWPTAILMVVGIATLIYGAVRNSADGVYAPFGIGFTIVLMIVGVPTAIAWRTRLVRLWPNMLWFLVPLGAATFALFALLYNERMRTGEYTLAGLCILALGVWNTILNQAKARQSMEYIEKRRRLCAAREYFRRELKSEQPRLRDEWFPWFIAFGLASNMDKWFRAFGGEHASRARTTAFGSSGSSSSSSPSTSWSGMGGGGGFSGGGSSGSWASAVGVMAAGVSKPSSSSSGGRSSGGSSSSGGGGGGGW